MVAEVTHSWIKPEASKRILEDILKCNKFADTITKHL